MTKTGGHSTPVREAERLRDESPTMTWEYRWWSAIADELRRQADTFIELQDIADKIARNVNRSEPSEPDSVDDVYETA